MPVFVVEDGTGLSNATSYVDTTYADDYLSIGPQTQNTEWAALTLGEKQTWLMFASRLIDQAVDWNGYKTVENSGLRWPREGACNCDGILIDKNTIPEEVKMSTVEVARYFVHNATLVPYSVVDDAVSLKKIRVAEITIEWKDGVPLASEINKFPYYISNIMGCLGTIVFTSYSGIKGSKFKPIIH